MPARHGARPFEGPQLLLDIIDNGQPGFLLKRRTKTQ
jgi:hypothetical protein